jgi:hypothetical protein
MKVSIIALSLFSLFAFSACKKEVTEVQQVKQAYSKIVSIAPSTWQLTSDSTRLTADIPVPEIDQYMYNNGGVLVYLQFEQGKWEALPETFLGLTYTYTHDQGGVTINIYEAYGGTINPNTLPNAPINAKIVLIDADPLN